MCIPASLQGSFSLPRDSFPGGEKKIPPSSPKSFRSPRGEHMDRVTGRYFGCSATSWFGSLEHWIVPSRTRNRTDEGLIRRQLRARNSIALRGASSMRFSLFDFHATASRRELEVIHVESIPSLRFNSVIENVR